MNHQNVSHSNYKVLEQFREINHMVPQTKPKDYYLIINNPTCKNVVFYCHFLIRICEK